MSELKDLIAIGTHVFVIKDEPETESGSFKLPDAALKKPNSGKVISIGGRFNKEVDAKLKKGMKALFNKSAGFPLEIFGTTIHVLRDDQVLGAYEDKE